VAPETFVDRVVTRLVHEPEGKRSLLGALVRFGITGGLSVATDAGTLAALHSGAGVHLLLSTVIAFAAGLVVNYTLNRNWTFQSQADHRRTMFRYGVMVAINFGTTLLIVLGLTHLGVFYLISKGVAVSLIAIVNFTAGRHWVFTQ
jgi:putative flippase GtrA